MKTLIAIALLLAGGAVCAFPLEADLDGNASALEASKFKKPEKRK